MVPMWISAVFGDTWQLSFVLSSAAVQIACCTLLARHSIAFWAGNAFGTCHCCTDQYTALPYVPGLTFWSNTSGRQLCVALHVSYCTGSPLLLASSHKEPAVAICLLWQEQGHLEHLVFTCIC